MVIEVIIPPISISCFSYLVIIVTDYFFTNLDIKLFFFTNWD